ncbi:hypothetical protein OSB04_007372 [Centaurea solstitialis]|uniref:Uncharacterized protein n=1 Tax=Centaurea solstitialis TaxID=347529 RepID=A0AA38U300_9ASTR|nr:hypothetical protein OSB04_007372 [Centaurea solstitialis]
MSTRVTRSRSRQDDVEVYEEVEEIREEEPVQTPLAATAVRKAWKPPIPRQPVKQGRRRGRGRATERATTHGMGLRHKEPLAGKKEDLTMDVLTKKFVTCKPPTFKGDRDPVLAMKWIMEMETIFDTCYCGEADKVVFARSMLK